MEWKPLSHQKAALRMHKQLRLMYRHSNLHNQKIHWWFHKFHKEHPWR